ncbi:MAG: TRAP transporter large permease subunit, partial [Candidatus Hodarchaeota archaeon]
MSFDIAIGIGGFIVLLGLIVIGVPVFISMLFVTIIGFWLLGGLPLMLSQFTYGLHFMAENYMFAVLPLFILVGEIATQTTISQNAFTAINKWVGKVRGAQLMTVVIANAVIGAISSSPSTGTVLSVRVAMPELEKIKYDKPYCLSAIIASGTLVSLIPPSASILTFCLLTGASVGRSLVASIIPGLLLTLVFCISIWVYGKIKPEKIPIESDNSLKVSWREKFLSLTTLLPVLILFLLLVGGIYLGVFTPTAGGAVAATAILIYAFLTKVPFNKIADAFKNTVILNSQIFPLIIAGFMFARFTTLTGMTDFLLDFVV